VETLARIAADSSRAFQACGQRTALYDKKGQRVYDEKHLHPSHLVRRRVNL